VQFSVVNSLWCSSFCCHKKTVFVQESNIGFRPIEINQVKKTLCEQSLFAALIRLLLKRSLCSHSTFVSRFEKKCFMWRMQTNLLILGVLSFGSSKSVSVLSREMVLFDWTKLNCSSCCQTVLCCLKIDAVGGSAAARQQRWIPPK